ncbi:HAD hydrolase-like protein [Tropicimonas sp. IMCC34011]|uniref:HAD hydrolase-like protein n=1 Tax=Tropicimonas sp. IMCC34011 TaxID=2248759 RepID=UPI000E270A03|nr:HAD hydrolase-like protein [Tropicimonas sp. IMCC34011]
MSALPPTIRALTVDTGGTVLDWYSGILRELQEFGRTRGLTADWSAVAKRWRRLSTVMVDDGMPQENGIATLDFDDVLRITQEQTWREFGLPVADADTRAELLAMWRRLDPWPDVRRALPRLRAKFRVAPFTILKTTMLIETSRRGGLDWDCIISCEMIGTYKTKRPAYDTAAHWLGVAPANILMVTGHNNDLIAAHSYGFRTAFIHRPKQWGDEPPQFPEADDRADFVCRDFADLAEQLGCP